MENQVSTGLSQFTGGANGLISSANCIGAPATVALTVGVYAPGCVLYQRDSSTGYRPVAWQNTGTTAAPAWTSLAIATIVSGSGATVTLTQAQSGSLVIFDRAAGIVFTLPSPVVGSTFRFAFLTSITSNSGKVITSAGTVFILGSMISIDTDSSNVTVGFTADGSTILSSAMNGTTTGGLKGTYFELTCLSSTIWICTGTVLGSGTVATPFATS